LKDRILYNLNKAKDYLADRKLIVVEGFKSVWWLYEMGIYNVVAVMGSTVTEGQKKLIYQYAHKGIVILFDNDVPGIIGTNNAFNQMYKKIEVHPIVMYGPEGTDPADLDKDILYKVLENYI
jgi:DNA primase